MKKKKIINKNKKEKRWKITIRKRGLKRREVATILEDIKEGGEDINSKIIIKIKIIQNKNEWRK